MINDFFLFLSQNFVFYFDRNSFEQLQSASDTVVPVLTNLSQQVQFCPLHPHLAVRE